LNSCKPHAKIINVSRGWIVDEQALYSFLSNNPLAWAYIDVWEHESKYTKSIEQLLSLNNFIMTPHISGRTNEALDRMHYFEFLA
jgi:phosphoglycerate dehydrogenase-like enzyme